jgi:O-antigen ligase
MDEPLRSSHAVGSWATALRTGGASARPAAGWDLLLVCIAVYIATGVGRVHQLFPVLLPLKPALLATVLGVGLFVLDESRLRRLDLLSSRSTACLAGLLVWCAFSVPGALNQGIAFFTWTDFARTCLMCVLLAGTVRSARDVERLVFIYFGSVVLYTAVILSRFQLGADDWRLGRLYNYDANDLATLIVSAIPFGLYALLARGHALVRVFAAAGLAVLATGLIRSGSRGGFLAFLAVAAFMLLGFTTLPLRKRIVGFVVILAVAGASASDQYWSQMQTLVRPNDDYNMTSDAGRMKIWERGVGYMTRHPILGVGAGNFNTAEGTISPLAELQNRGIGVRWGAAHNSFIQVGAELGVPGLLLFAGLLGNLFASQLRVVKYARGAGPPGLTMSRLAQSNMAALVGFVVGAFFLSLAYMDMLYTLAALSMALSKIARNDEARSRYPRFATS